MLGRLALAIMVAAQPALAQNQPSAEASAPAPTKVETTTPTFEMFRMVPGQLEAFIKSMALYDQVSIAGGQPPTQLFLHTGGEGWDVLLYKPARPKPTAAQEAAMEAKLKEMGLATGSIYFLKIREQMAVHTHFEASGPTTAAAWLADLERQRRDARAKK